MAATIRLGISACLLGEKVRYDGRDRLDPHLVEALGPHVEWVPVCPEVEMGLPVPREPMRLVGEPSAPRLVTVESGVDHTDRMRRWAARRLEELDALGLSGFVFKSGSPSSGMAGVQVYTPEGRPHRTGRGLFAGALLDRFPHLPAEEDIRLHDPLVLAAFLLRLGVKSLY